MSLPTVAGPHSNDGDAEQQQPVSLSYARFMIDYLLPLVIIHGVQAISLGLFIASRNVVPHLAGYFGVMVATSVIPLFLGMRRVGRTSLWRGVYHVLYGAGIVYGIGFAWRTGHTSLIWTSPYLIPAIGLIEGLVLLLSTSIMDQIYIEVTSAAGWEPGTACIVDFHHVISLFTASCSPRCRSRISANEPPAAPENHKMTGHHQGSFVNWLSKVGRMCRPFQILQKSPNEEMLLGHVSHDPSQMKIPDEEETLLGPDYV